MDHNSFIKLLVDKLRENEFRFSDKNTSAVCISSELPGILYMEKIYGSALCLLRIITGDNTGPADSFILHNEPGPNIPLPVFIIYLFVYQDFPLYATGLINQGEEYRDQKIFKIFWGIRLEPDKLSLIHGSKQPDQFLDLRRIIKETEKKFFNSSLSVPLYPSAEARPLLAYGLIILNGLLLILTYAGGGPWDIDNLIRLGALDPSRVFQYGEVYRLLTAMFLHGGIIHYLSNSLGLYIFGARMERFLGHGWFLALYLISGLAGSLLSLLFSSAISVGASGGIFGLVGAALAAALLSRRALWGLSLYTLVIYSLVCLGMGFLINNIGHWAHFGGYGAGFLLGWIICGLKKQEIKKP